MVKAGLWMGDQYVDDARAIEGQVFWDAQQTSWAWRVRDNCPPAEEVSGLAEEREDAVRRVEWYAGLMRLRFPGGARREERLRAMMRVADALTDYGRNDPAVGG